MIAIYPTAEELSKAVAEHIVNTIRSGAAEWRMVRIALAGGETPRRSYEQLRTYGDDVPWEWSEWYWTDERMVPPAAVHSNSRMAQAAFLQVLKLPEGRVFPMPFGDAEQSAASYAALLRERFHGQIPCFDLILLGVGRDGHTASLFPGQPAVLEKEQWVAAVREAPDGLERVTLTLPVINQARNVVFLVAGEEKADVVRNLLGRQGEEGEMPARMVRLKEGILQWYLDEPAAQALRRELA